MSDKKPIPTEQIESLLRGQLPLAESERLATQLADDSRLSEVGAALPDDTLASAIRGVSTELESNAESMAQRLVDRLRQSVDDPTMTAMHSTDGPMLIDDEEPAPASLEYFRIIRVLGQGGMGTVYLADDTRLNRTVAIKTLRSDVASRPGAKERFLREARSAAALEHDCLVPIYYVGESGNIPFLAMPLLKGQALDDYLSTNGGKLSLEETTHISREIARGLAAAHEAKMIHRDIKPSNVWIEGPGGRVRILDFGLARSVQDNTQLTASGMIVGTPAYMAPEQARGRAVDGRADLFSLGVIMYLMLTGKRPFVGNDTVAILSSLALDHPMPPREVNPAVPQHLSDLVMKLLAKNPDDRLPSAAAVVAALSPVVVPASWREQEPTEKLFSEMTAPTPGQKKRPTQAKPARTVPVAVSIALAVALLGGLVVGVYQFAFSTKDGTLVVEVDKDADVRFKNGKLEIFDEAGKKLYTLEPSEKNKTLPPGKYRVKVVGTDGVKLDTETFELEKKGKAWVKVTAVPPKDVAVVDPKKPAPKKPDPVTPAVPPSVPGVPLALRQPTWKPGPADNILSGLVPRPAILDTVGRWQVVPTVAPSWGVSFSPDAKWVALVDVEYVRIYDAATGALKALGKRTNGNPSQMNVLGFAWSPDSKWLRVAHFHGWEFNSVEVFATDGTRSPMPLIPNADADSGWNPKFPLFACRDRRDPDRLFIFDPAQEKPVAVETPGVQKAAWSPNGEWLLVVRADMTAQLFARDGKPGAKLAGEMNPALTPVWSADGTQIAALASDAEIGFWTADGTAGKKTGKHEKPILALHWKPDGKLLAVSDAEGKRHFWKPDGTSEWVADTKINLPGFEWAKDGKGFFTPGKFWPAVGNPSFTEIQQPNYWAAVSPDQASVAMAKRGEIVVVELKDGAPKDIGWTVLQTRDGAPWWSPDGKRLAVADQNGVSLYDARDPKKVVRLGGGAGVNGFHRAAFSPKGDRLAVANDIGHLFICEPTGKVLRALSAPTRLGATLTDAVHDLSWHPDGKLLAVTTGVATVTVFDTETGKVEATASVQGARSGGSAIFSPANPDHLLIAHPDQAALWRWKVEKEPLQKYAGLGKLIPSPDGKKVLSLQAGAAHHGNEIVAPAILSPDLKDRSPLDGKEYLPANNQAGAAPAWHPDGKHLIVTRLIESRSIQIRSLDGKVVEEIKPEGVDVTWLEWLTPAARRNVLVGRIGHGPDHYLFDVAAKKLTTFGKVPGEVIPTPDGKYLIALEGSTLTYWNVNTKVIEQRVVLLPNGEFVTLSVAGEVLEKSANADGFFRYVVEDKSGKLLLKTPAEMAPLLPQGNAPVGWAPTAEQQAFLAAVTALPANERVAAVLRKMQELNLVGFTERPWVGFELDPKDGVPTSCRVTSPITYVGWPLAALTSLKKLDLTETHILDFRPLAALPLEEIQLKLILDNTDSEAALKAMPTLKTINGIAAKDFWAERAAVRADIEKMIGKLEALSPEDQTTWIRGIMKRLHPKVPDAAFNGVGVLKAENGLLLFRGYDLHAGVYDFAPVRALAVESFFLLDGNLFDATPLGQCKKLKEIFLNRGNAVRDLSPLAGLSLTELHLAGSYSDIRPLKGMPLKRLSFGGTADTDLSPLQGMPLESLELGGVKDLKPIAGLKLKRLVSGHYSPIDDLSPLKGMPLEVLLLHRSKVTDISPLAGIKFKEFSVFESPVADYAPLKGSEITSLNIYRGIVDPVLATLPLKSIELLPRLYSLEEEKVLRGLKVETINSMKPEDFWKDVEKRRQDDAAKTAEMAKVPLEEAALVKALWILGQYPKVKIEGGAVVEVEAGHTNGGVDNRFAVLLAFPKIRKLKLDSGGDYSALLKLTELEELTCQPLEVGFNRLTLSQMPKLKTINGQSAKDVLNGKFDRSPLGSAPLDPAWLKAVAAMPPEKQYEAVIAEVKARNPEFTGKGPRNGRVIEEGVLAELVLDGKLADVTPARALPGLKRLSVCNTPDHNAIPLPLADLTQFQGMKLTHLSVWHAAATDLTPLKGMPLTKLELSWTKVTDLTPLAGMPLEYLDLRGCPVQDLTPIKGLKLKVLGLLGTQVADLKAVVEMPLESLECGSRITDLTLLKGKKLKLLRFDGDVVSDLSPLKGMPLDLLGWWGSKVTDLSPLEGMPLKNLEYELNLGRDGKVLRSLKSLETINGKPAKGVLEGK